MHQKSSRVSKNDSFPVWVFWIPALIYILHTLLFRHWIIDDAGISFSYARSLAGGYGLVSQPGQPPVEGYTNFGWLVLFVPFFLAHLFHPVLIPKLLSAAAVLGAGIFLYRAFRNLSTGPTVIFFIFLLLSICTPFVVWTCSGLENPLMVCGVSLLFWLTLRIPERPSGTAGLCAAMGFTAAWIAMTRPDGLVYFFVPLAVLAASGYRREKRGLVYMLSFALLYGSFIAFRIGYFKDVFPNTYYAKGSPGWSALMELALLSPGTLAKTSILFSSLTWKGGFWLLLGLVAAAGYCSGKNAFNRKDTVVLLFLAASAFAYLFLPVDWMREFRFATVFFVFAYAAMFLLFDRLMRLAPIRERIRKKFLWTGLVLFTLASLGLFAKRSLDFSRRPTVPFAEISSNFGEGFNRCAERLGLKNASILLPDLGGTLYFSKMRVIDLSGLCDRTIARTLGKNNEALHRYVFETVKPDFIHVHDWWSYVSALHADPRLQEEYAVIHESPDPWCLERFGANVLNGDYVRKELVLNDPAALLFLREQTRRFFEKTASSSDQPKP